MNHPFLVPPGFTRLVTMYDLDMEPRGKGRPRGTIVNAKTPTNLSFKGRSVRIGSKTDDATRVWCEEAKLKLNLMHGAASQCKIDYWDAPIWVGLELRYARPKAMKKTILWAESKAIDNDNAEKMVWDAMNGIFYRDDHKIVANSTIKIWTDSRPGITIMIGKVA